MRLASIRMVILGKALNLEISEKPSVLVLLLTLRREQGGNLASETETRDRAWLAWHGSAVEHLLMSQEVVIGFLVRHIYMLHPQRSL